MLEVFVLHQCSTCRKALAGLDSQGMETLLLALKASARPTAVFNTSGQDYRSSEFPEKWPSLSPEAIAMELHAYPNWIKRPFVAENGTAWSGFSETAWSRRFALIKD